MNFENPWFCLGIGVAVLIIAIIVGAVILTSLATSRRLKRGEAAHHIVIILHPNGCDRDTVLWHFEKLKAILSMYLLWKVSLSDAGYDRGDLDRLWTEAEVSIMRHRQNQSAMKLAPKI